MEESDYDEVVEIPDTPERNLASNGRVRIASTYVLGSGLRQNSRQLSMEGSSQANGDEFSYGAKYSSKGKAAEYHESRNGDSSFMKGDKQNDLAADRRDKISLNPLKANIPSSDRRASGNKRLVRNGCISPSNIALRAKTLAPTREMSSNTGNSIDVDKMDHENEGARKFGRSNDIETNCYSSTSMTSIPEITRNRNARRDSFKCSLNGDVSVNEVNLVTKAKGKRRWDQCAGESSSSISVRDEEVLCLGSSRGSSKTDSCRVRESGRKNSLRPIPEDEHLLDFEILTSDRADYPALETQLLTDEQLAFELQEKFLSELSTCDESLAWALQEEENSNPGRSITTPSSSRQRNTSTSSSRSHHAQSLRNTSTRRDTSSRSLRSRSGVSIRSSVSSTRNPRANTSSSRVRDIQFPVGMDLDMRLNILEAMEEGAIGDFGDLSLDMNSARIENPYRIHFGLNFNESEYEMLLSLDERVPSTLGLTENQLHNLPESTVQVDSLDETCAICLEIPSKGEKIRHLPCLHKFHLDCIDTWLGRQKFCPICKASAA